MDAETSFGLGRELENWGGAEDLPAMRTHYRDAAEAGLVEAMGRLGLLCEGRTQAKLENRLPAEVQGDFVEAARWYRTAADRGDLYAAFWLGRLYAERLGAGPRRSPGIGRRWTPDMTRRGSGWQQERTARPGGSRRMPT
ncbi:sel1 repeat family protein [Streptomyces sp. So13.3]|uniref:tetratricopeptide repeat protein n=1 Tax=Streptomyces TaxID=1883 RepID=UPI0011058868|nr:MULTISPECIES: sel1 repeat family protein [Streptomyces]MCZ4102974.1 sel1 repeat family protein [Streptomyces sp. H39-C1]QNA77208.1 sel1 repeat family protein [Streptomyces sp. So13.3]